MVSVFNNVDLLVFVYFIIVIVGIFWCWWCCFRWEWCVCNWLIFFCKWDILVLMVWCFVFNLVLLGFFVLILLFRWDIVLFWFVRWGIVYFNWVNFICNFLVWDWVCWVKMFRIILVWFIILILIFVFRLCIWVGERFWLNIIRFVLIVWIFRVIFWILFFFIIVWGWGCDCFWFIVFRILFLVVLISWVNLVNLFLNCWLVILFIFSFIKRIRFWLELIFWVINFCWNFVFSLLIKLMKFCLVKVLRLRGGDMF